MDICPERESCEVLAPFQGLQSGHNSIRSVYKRACKCSLDSLDWGVRGPELSQNFLVRFFVRPRTP